MTIVQITKKPKDFPFDSLRPGVEDALIKASHAIKNSKVKFILIDAPTGSGKSGIAVFLARKLKGHIATPTKILQKQYIATKEFDREFYIQGKDNYTCSLSGFEANKLSIAPCSSKGNLESFADHLPFPKESIKTTDSLKKSCISAQGCEYFEKIFSLPHTFGGVLNYALLFSIKETKGKQSGIKLGSGKIIFDEAHELISQAQNHFSISLRSDKMVELLGHGAAKKGQDVFTWFSKIISLAHLHEKNGNLDENKKNTLSNLIPKIEMLYNYQNKKSSFFITEDHENAEIKPIMLSDFKDELFYGFDKVIMLSATFPKNFTNYFGINEDEYEKIDIASNFPLENRPAYYICDKNSARHKVLVANKDTVYDVNNPQIYMTKVILEKHITEKGIIHCASYKILEELQKTFGRDPRFIWAKRNDDADALIAKHKASKLPTVLVSPAMMQGVDLKDDLARFQIIFKVPYPILDDFAQLLKVKVPYFYEDATILNLTQEYGRIVRNEKDHGTTYIVDGAFKNLYENNKDRFPNYFREALKPISPIEFQNMFANKK